ncbi:MAG: 3'-5' exonuclease [Cellvibrionaceae bacterium]
MSNFALFYDTETTGLPDWKSPSGSDSQPHLVQLAAILADEDTRKVVASIDVIIRPDGWEIPQEVSEIHGITTEHAAAVGVPEKMAFEMLMALWGGNKRVAHNRTFDQRIIRIAAKRYAAEEVIDSWAEKDNHECSMLLSKPILQLPSTGRGGFKQPKLEEAYKHFTGKDLENAHTAMADTVACMEVYWGILDSQRSAA